MSVCIGQNVNPNFINRFLATHFEIMNDNMGIRTIKLFLQDVARIDGLLDSLARTNFHASDHCSRWWIGWVILV